MTSLRRLQGLFRKTAAAKEAEERVVACLGKGHHFFAGVQIIGALREDLGPPIRSPMAVRGLLRAASGPLRQAVEEFLSRSPVSPGRGGRVACRRG
eukprot:4962760-Lingulodinium_polyedra.AAC.1